MTEREALKLALEAFANIKNDPFKFDLKDDIDNSITAIKEVLAQPEQEPSAWTRVDVNSPILHEEMMQKYPELRQYYPVPLYYGPQEKAP